MGWRGVLFVPLTFFLMLGGTLSVLLHVAITIIIHPFTALKKTKRDGKPAYSSLASPTFRPAMASARGARLCCAEC